MKRLPPILIGLVLLAGCSQTQSISSVTTTSTTTTTTSTTTTTISHETPHIVIVYPIPSTTGSTTTTATTTTATTTTVTSTATTTVATATTTGTTDTTSESTTTTTDSSTTTIENSTTTTIQEQTSTTTTTSTTVTTTTTTTTSTSTTTTTTTTEPPTTTTITTTSTTTTTTTSTTTTTLPGGSANAITGAFIALDDSNVSRSQARWNKELEWLRQAGMETVIVQCSVNEKTTYYPTSLPGYSQAGTQPIAKILTAADASNMDVHIGLLLTNSWWNNTDPVYLDLLTASSEAIAQELWNLYGSHSSFKGMYIPEEVDNLTWTTDALRNTLVNHFLQPLSNYLKGLNDSLVVSEAPFFNSADQQPAAYQTWWTSVLAATPSLTLLMPQDGIGAGHADLTQMTNYFNALRVACAVNSRDLWSDLEIYESPTNPVPAAISRISGQIQTEAPLVNKIVCWEFGYYLSPGQSIKTLDLFNDYNRFLNGRGALTNVSDAKSYFLSIPPSPVYPDSGGELTNGAAPFDWPGQVGWSNQPAVSIRVDLGAVNNNLLNFRAYFMRSTASSVNLPSAVSVSVSPDGINYTLAGSLAQINDEDQAINPYQLLLTSPVSGRYVRFDITPGANWLMLSEVGVYSGN